MSFIGHVAPPSYILSFLKVCKTIRSLEAIHARIILNGLEQDNFFITQFVCRCNSISNAYVPYALMVFNQVLLPNIYLWNSILKAHSKNSSLINTMSLFKRLKLSRTPPDNFTFPSLIKCCSDKLAIGVGKAIHGSVMRYGIDSDIFVATSLIDLYGKSQEIHCARKVFDAMSKRNEVSWTAMIVGYVNFGDLEVARTLFAAMPYRNCVSWNAMMDGYVKCGDMRNAQKLFDDMPTRNLISFTSLIDGYAKVGDMATARNLFDEAPDRDIVAWSALISGYVQNGQPNEAVKIFLEMCNKNVKPDEFIMVSLMSACSRIGRLQLAMWVDSYVSQNVIDVSQFHVVAALIDMNAKCGNMNRATSLFEEVPKRDLISYCSMIQGLSLHGCGAHAIQLFDKMLEEGLIPDEVAFTVVLNACSHAGLIQKGLHYIYSMKNNYGLIPSPDHYACIINLLGKAGHLEAAYDLIKSMPVEPHAGAWGALLGACRLHCNIKIGEMVARQLFRLEPHNGGNYVLLSDIYATANRWLDVLAVRSLMRERGVRKVPGCSCI